MASGAYTHTHAYTPNESDYKKPGAPAYGRRAWFKNSTLGKAKCYMRHLSIALLFYTTNHSFVGTYLIHSIMHNYSYIFPHKIHVND